MKQFKYIFIALAICLLFVRSGCDKHPKEYPYPLPTGTLKLELESDINGSKIILNSVKYLNEHLDTFKVSRLKYYVSNIRLKRADGTYYNIPESYYLIDVSMSNDTTINIPNIPVGSYIQAEISIGVDVERNHTGAQTGALDPTVAGDMFWLWSTGYRFVLLEGNYKTAASGGFAGLVFHVSDDVNYKSTSFNAGTANWTDINIRDGKSTRMHVKANFEEMFKTPTTINFDVTNNVSGPPDANTIANNYEDMLGLAGIVNE
jgi:hypothetical protein